MATSWIVAKSTTLAALVLLGVSNKWGSSPTPRSSRYLIHNHHVPHPLPWSTLVPTVSWIHNVLRPIIWRPLSRVSERHEAGAPCVHKRVDTELVRYPPLDIVVRCLAATTKWEHRKWYCLGLPQVHLKSWRTTTCILDSRTSPSEVVPPLCSTW